MIINEFIYFNFYIILQLLYNLINSLSLIRSYLSLINLYYVLYENERSRRYRKKHILQLVNHILCAHNTLTVHELRLDLIPTIIFTVKCSIDAEKQASPLKKLRILAKEGLQYNSQDGFRSKIFTTIFINLKLRLFRATNSQSLQY